MSVLICGWLIAKLPKMVTRRDCDFFIRTRSKNLEAVAYGNPTRQRGRVGFVLAHVSGYHLRPLGNAIPQLAIPQLAIPQLAIPQLAMPQSGYFH